MTETVGVSCSEHFLGNLFTLYILHFSFMFICNVLKTIVDSLSDGATVVKGVFICWMCMAVNSGLSKEKLCITKTVVL